MRSGSGLLIFASLLDQGRFSFTKKSSFGVQLLQAIFYTVTLEGVELTQIVVVVALANLQLIERNLLLFREKTEITGRLYGTC